MINVLPTPSTLNVMVLTYTSVTVGISSIHIHASNTREVMLLIVIVDEV